MANKRTGYWKRKYAWSHKTNQPYHKKKTYNKKTVSRKETTKIATKVAKKVALANNEMKWCNPYSYDDYADLDVPRQNERLNFPSAIPGVNISGSSAFLMGLETGTTLSTQASNLNAALTPIGPGNDCINMIGMYNFPATPETASGGTSAGLDNSMAREGEYMYAHSQRVDMSILMRKLQTEGDVRENFSPYEFRVIVVKRRPRRVVATGAGPDFRTDLFRTYNNSDAGFLNNMSVKQLMDYKINKQAFSVIKDFKFKLSPVIAPNAQYTPQDPNLSYTFPYTGNTYNSFPNEKNITLYLPKPKHKIKWEGNRDTDPDNSFNYKCNIFIIASQTGTENEQNSADRWLMRVQTESKFRDC